MSKKTCFVELEQRRREFSKTILALLRVEGDICALLESNKESHDSSAAQRSASLSDPLSAPLAFLGRFYWPSSIAG